MHSTRSDPPPRSDPQSRTDPGDLGALARLCGLATVLGLAVLALLGIGRRLPAPPLSFSASRSADAWSAWLARLGPAGALMSLVRVVAILLAGYLLTLVVIEVIGRAAGLPRLLSIGRLLSTPLARHLVGGAAGLGLAFSVTALTLGPTAVVSADTISMRSPTTAAADPTPPPTTAAQVSAGPLMHALGPDDGAEVTDAPTMTTIEPEAPAMHAVDPPPAPVPTPASPPTSSPPPPNADAPSDPGGPGPDAVADRWVIQSGDHLWGVARRTLAGTWHRPPTDAETARYLDRLVEANLDVLVVPGDADLVRPGQVFLLPLVPTG